MKQARFSPNGQYVVTLGNDYSAHLWTVAGQHISSFAPQVNTNETAERCKSSATRLDLSATAEFSLDNRFLVMALGSSSITVVDTTGKMIAQWDAHDDCIQQVRFSPTENIVVTASDDGTAKIWTLTGQHLVSLEGHRANVIDAHFSPDGQTIATSSYDATARLWSRDGTELVSLGGLDNCRNDPTQQNCTYSVQFSPDSQSVVTVSDDGTAQIWDLRGRLLADLADSRSPVYGVSIGSDSQSMLVQLNESVRLWQVKHPDALILEGCDWLLANQVITSGNNLATRSLNELFLQDELALCSPERVTARPIWASS